MAIYSKVARGQHKA